MEVPVLKDLSDLPLGLRAEARDAFLRFSQGQIYVSELALRLFALATQMNRRPSDRYSYADLSRLELDDQEETELVEGALKVIQPLLERIKSLAAEEPQEKNSPTDQSAT